MLFSKFAIIKRCYLFRLTRLNHHKTTSQELILRPKLCAYLFGNGTLDDALAVLGGFDSAMDEPVMLMPGGSKRGSTAGGLDSLITIENDHL